MTTTNTVGTAIAQAADPARQAGAEASADPAREAPSGAADPARIGRREAAQRIGASPRTLQRLEERGRLEAHRDDTGRVWYAIDEVDRVASELDAARAAASADSPASPDQLDNAHRDAIAAAVFRALNAGRGPHQVVAECEIAPEIVRRHYNMWLELAASEHVSRSVCARLVKHLGPNKLLWGEHLERLVAAYAQARADTHQWQYPCTVCGEAIIAGQEEWKALLAGGTLADWGHAGCLDR